MVHSVAVIGAGASGLAAVKCCLDEGFEPTCFERTDHIGGLWHYTDQVQEGHVTVMKNTIANVSKEVTSFADFPPPPQHPIYWHNKDLEEYLQSYAEHFGLEKHIRLNMQVVNIYETNDHKVTGRWNVKVKDVLTDSLELLSFDAVLVCTGVYSKPSIPSFTGMDKFKGKVMHTQQYKDSRGFEDQRVLVVGIGNSAADAAVDISEVTRQVFLSSRNGGWLLTRLNKHGRPMDMALLSRFSFKLLTLFPNLMNKLLMKQCNNKIDHYRFGINPKYSPSRSNSTVNDQLAYKLLISAIKMKPEIKCFTENGVEFVDGSHIDDIDVVVLGTGYLPEFPFLDQNVIGEDKTHLYLGMFPPEREIQTLATIGCFRIKGPVLPVVEMQSRIATKVFKDEVKLSDTVTMLDSIKATKQDCREKKVYSLQAVTQIDYFPYMDTLAAMIGCKPNFWKLLLGDPPLALKYMFGPVNSYQYRLVGPGCWSGARDAIFTQWDRTYYPILQGKPAPRPKDKSSCTIYAWIGVLLVFALCMYMGFMQ